MLYGCETWSLTLKEERVLRLFGIGCSGRYLEPERDLATGEWRKLLNEELNYLYSSTNIFSGHQIENNKTGGA
jgi:hypothetical protein